MSHSCGVAVGRTNARMADASVSWTCGRHHSTFDQCPEYGPVPCDTNNEGQSATDNDVEIGDDRLRLEHLCTRVSIDALLHFCSLRQFLPLVRKTHSTLCHSPPHDECIFLPHLTRIRSPCTIPIHFTCICIPRASPGHGEHANGADASPRL